MDLAAHHLELRQERGRDLGHEFHVHGAVGKDDGRDLQLREVLSEVLSLGSAHREDQGLVHLHLAGRARHFFAGDRLKLPLEAEVHLRMIGGGGIRGSRLGGRGRRNSKKHSRALEGA